MMETCCNYTGDVMFISTDERWLINRLMRFKEARPDEVEIIRNHENNDGCLYCKVPADWLKITPPAKRELTDDQRAAMAERLRNCRK